VPCILEDTSDYEVHAADSKKNGLHVGKLKINVVGCRLFLILLLVKCSKYDFRGEAHLGEKMYKIAEKEDEQLFSLNVRCEHVVFVHSHDIICILSLKP
jgi:hypothetical protein